MASDKQYTRWLLSLRPTPTPIPLGTGEGNNAIHTAPRAAALHHLAGLLGGAFV